MKTKNKFAQKNTSSFSDFFVSIFRDKDSQINDIARYSLMFIAVITPLCLIMHGLKGMIVFLLSAILMFLNLGWLKELVDLLISDTADRAGKTRNFAKFFVLFLLLGFCLYAIIAIWETDVVVPLLLGISTLVAGIFCVSMKELFRSKKG
jgi:hypothetical protein